VTAGVGWIIWRDESCLPKDLIFELHYLGGKEESYTLNFSRPGAQVIVQYYNLIHLGFSGYREAVENCLANARILSQSLEATGWYTCVSDIHRPARSPRATEAAAAAAADVTQRVKGAVSSVMTGTTTASSATTTTPAGTSAGSAQPETSAAYIAGLPVVSFRFSDAFRAAYPHIKQETVSLLLRARQWIIPNYALPPHEADTEILRVVVRVSMSFDLLDRLVTDIVQVTETLMAREDEVDLAVLQEQRREPHLRRKKSREVGAVGQGEAEKKKEAEGKGKKEGGPKELGKKAKKRMEDGIHRTVC
jgi:glutamate decarboxylase